MPSDFSFLRIDRKNCPSVMVRLMDKSKVFHTSSPIRVPFLSPRPFSYCYSEFLIPGLWYCHRFGRFCKRCPFACRSSVAQKSASVSTSVSTECVCDERFLSNFLKLLNTTHGLVEPRRKNCPSIKVETGAWPSFSMDNIRPKPVYGIVFGHFLVKACCLKSVQGGSAQHLSRFLGQWLD